MSCVPSINAYVATQACQSQCPDDLKRPSASIPYGNHRSQQDKKSWWDWSSLNYKDWSGFKYIFLGHDGVGFAGPDGNLSVDPKSFKVEGNDTELTEEKGSRIRHISASSTASSEGPPPSDIPF